MKNPSPSWQVVARRQWPLALALTLFMCTEAYSRRHYAAQQWWELPGSLLIVGLAVLAPRRPLDAAIAASATIIASTLLLRFMHVHVADLSIGLMVSEFGSVMALIAIVARQAPAARAMLGTIALLAATAIAVSLRPSRYGAPSVRLRDLAGVSIWVLLFVLAVGTGLYFRTRDQQQARSEARSIASAQQTERLTLARELHDVVAHYVTGIVVHSQAAEAVADKEPAAARNVLPIITSSGNEALTAMRRLVGTLRGADPAGPTSADNSQLAARVTQLVEQSGGPVRLTVELTNPVPLELGRSVIRLVQESLTNARKHASGVTSIDVEVRTTDDSLLVLVVDNGTGKQHVPAGGSGGYGLVGMRERVELLGGSFSAGLSGKHGHAKPDGRRRRSGASATRRPLGRASLRGGGAVKGEANCPHVSDLGRTG